MYEIEKQENGKFKLYELPGMVNKGNLKDEEIALKVKHLLNMDQPNRQLVSLSHDTCKMIGELMEYYADKGAPTIKRADIINAAVEAIHRQIFTRQEE